MTAEAEYETDDTALVTIDTDTQVDHVRPIDKFKSQLDQALPTISAMLPAHVTMAQFKARVITTVAYNPKLLECTPQSLLRACAELAGLGLDSNPKMKEADILPRWNNRLKKNEANAEPRFEGLMKLARQSGEVLDIYAHEVYENDEFRYSLGLDRTLHHIPASGDRGEVITFGYVVWTSKNGIKSFEVIDRKRIDKARASSESYKAMKAGKIKAEYVTWVQHEGEMVRKTAVRAGAKYMPKSTENDAFRKALALMEPEHLEIEEREESAEALPPPPPRPTRQAARQVEREETEEARQGNYEMDRQFRDTVRETPAKPTEPTMSKTEAMKFGPQIKKAVVAADTLDKLAAVGEEHADALAAIEHHLPILHGEIGEMIAGKREHLEGKK